MSEHPRRVDTVPPEDTASVLVAGVGNIFLSDDGFGSEVARQLSEADLPEGMVVGDYGIGGVHLAYDLLEGYETLVLVDTTDRGGEPGDIFVIEVDHDNRDVDPAGAALDSHSMDPAAMFSSLETLGGTPPRTLMIGCQPADMSDGMGLSEPVEAAVGVAVDKVRELVGELLEEDGGPAGDQSSQPATVETDREEG